MCLYSTYFYLLYISSNITLNGQTMQRLRNAVGYNRKMGKNSLFKPWKKNRGKIRRVRSTNDAAVQTTEPSTNSMTRLWNILEGPDAANLYKDIDIFTDDYGIIECDAITFLFDKSKTSAKNTMKYFFIKAKHLTTTG